MYTSSNTRQQKKKYQALTKKNYQKTLHISVDDAQQMSQSACISKELWEMSNFLW